MYLSCLLPPASHHILPIPCLCALLSIHPSASGRRPRPPARPPARSHSIQPIEPYAHLSFPISYSHTIPMTAPLPLPLLYLSTYAPHLPFCIMIRPACEIHLIARVLHPLSIRPAEQEEVHILNHHRLSRCQQNPSLDRNQDGT